MSYLALPLGLAMHLTHGTLPLSTLKMPPDLYRKDYSIPLSRISHQGLQIPLKVSNKKTPRVTKF